MWPQMCATVSLHNIKQIHAFKQLATRNPAVVVFASHKHNNGHGRTKPLSSPASKQSIVLLCCTLSLILGTLLELDCSHAANEK